MIKSSSQNIHFVVVACLLFCGACKEKENPPKTVTPATNNSTVKKTETTNAVNAVIEEIQEEAPPKPFKYQSVLSVVPDFESLSFSEPIGTISGEVYGEKRPVLAVARARCGDGTVLQAIYQGEKGVEVSTPMPTRYIGLGTKKKVEYTEGDFNVAINFSEDSPAKLTGSFAITYKENGIDRTFVDLVVDGKPIPHLYPPKLKGSGKVPKYEKCSPTGYFKAEIDGLPTMYGYVHATDVNGAGVPKIRLLFSPQDGIDLFLIPLKKGMTFKEVSIGMESSRIKGENAAVLQADVFRLPEINLPSEATGSNLDHMSTEPILEGSALVTLEKKNVAIEVKGFEISDTLKGPLDQKLVKSIKVEAAMVPEGTMSFKLGDPPEWWKGE